jgi:Domain of unknown function (DUF4279)
MSCILTIKGENLDVEGFIRQTGLQPYKKFLKGDPKTRSKPEGKKFSFSGLSLEASSADFNQLDKQIQDTIEFLRSNKEKLCHIAVTKEVDFATLDFGIELRIDFERVVYQFEHFPAELLRLAGELGISLDISLYPPPGEDGGT